MAGMPLPLISEWLGHSQLETTTIYARATTDMKRKAAEKITTKETVIARLIIQPSMMTGKIPEKIRELKPAIVVIMAKNDGCRIDTTV